MSVTEETLMAFADGELPRAEAERVAALVAADPALAARVERMRGLRGALRKAFDPVLEEPIPERFTALLSQLDPPAAEQAPIVERPAPATVTDIAAARERRRTRFGPPAWTAIAASLVLGVMVGRIAAPESLFDGSAGQLSAGAALSRVLEQRLAADGVADATRVGVSFRSRDGAYCRTFTHAARAAAVSGLACREDEGWAVRIAVQERGGAGDYRQAAATAPAVLEAVDALIDGEPLDAEGEEAARANQWRSS